MPIMAARLEVSFVSLHYAYFIVTSLIGSVILYTTSSQIIDLHYVDALFMSCSAMVGTGLNVVRPGHLFRMCSQKLT